jgi:hypothetical protein
MVALIIVKMSKTKDHDVVSWKTSSADCGSQAGPRLFHTAMQTDLVPELIKKNLDQSGYSTRRRESISAWAKSGMQINKGLNFMSEVRGSMIQPAGHRR